MTEMTELGSLLRQERERQGLSHDEIARRTKVAKRTLLAIESGEKDELPHPVYAKGFVKTYARTLGLDAEALGRKVDEAYAEEVAEHESAEIVVKGTTPLKKRGKNWGLIVAVLLILTLGAGGVYFVVNNFDLLSGALTNSSSEQSVGEATEQKSEPAAEAEKDSDTVEGETSGAQTVTDAAKAVAGVVEDAVTDVANTVAEQNSTEEADASGADTPQPVSAESAASGAAAGTEVSPTGASSAGAQRVDSVKKATPPAQPVSDSGSPASGDTVAGQEEIAESAQNFTPEVPPVADEAPAVSDLPVQRVRVVASGDCWIEAWGQGLEKKSLYLRDGQAFVFTYTTNLIVKLGNSGVIKLLHNGKPYAFDGEDGKVKYVEFGEER